MTYPLRSNDLLFRTVFGQPGCEPLLRPLLNALLNLSGRDRIAEVVILSPHAIKETIYEQGAILDVKARDDRGRLYNIEVQLSSEVDFVNRSLYDLARLFSEQIEICPMSSSCTTSSW